MIRVTQHTRRKSPGPPCVACKREIRPGQVYRQLVGMDADIFGGGFVLHVAHDECADGAEGWDVDTPERLARRADASLDGPRRVHGFRGRVGDPCLVFGCQGEVIGGDGGYVLVRTEATHRAGACHHPHDVFLADDDVRHPDGYTGRLEHDSSSGWFVRTTSNGPWIAVGPRDALVRCGGAA